MRRAGGVWEGQKDEAEVQVGKEEGFECEERGVEEQEDKDGRARGWRDKGRRERGRGRYATVGARIPHEQARTHGIYRRLNDSTVSSFE